jgi:hypothetical protein
MQVSFQVVSIYKELFEGRCSIGRFGADQGKFGKTEKTAVSTAPVRGRGCVSSGPKEKKQNPATAKTANSQTRAAVKSLEKKKSPSNSKRVAKVPKKTAANPRHLRRQAQKISKEWV